MQTRTVARIAARSTLLALLLCAGLSACSSSEDKKKNLVASDYDQTCGVDPDCVIIDIGACECSCANAVINVKDYATFQHDLEQCDTGGNSCGMCPWMGEEVPYCNAGHCDSKLLGDAGSDGG